LQLLKVNNSKPKPISNYKWNYWLAKRSGKKYLTFRGCAKIVWCLISSLKFWKNL